VTWQVVCYVDSRTGQGDREPQEWGGGRRDFIGFYKVTFMMK
jgi:hypothetical protein